MPDSVVYSPEATLDTSFSAPDATN